MPLAVLLITTIGVLRSTITTMRGTSFSTMVTRATTVRTTTAMCVLFGLSRPEPVEGLTTRTELVEVFIHLTPHSSTVGNLIIYFRSPRKRSIFEKTIAKPNFFEFCRAEQNNEIQGKFEDCKSNNF